MNNVGFRTGVEPTNISHTKVFPNNETAFRYIFSSTIHSIAF